MSNPFLIKKDEKPSVAKIMFNIVLVALIIYLIFYFSLKVLGIVLDFSFVIVMRTRIFDGFIMTIIISILSLIISLAIGIVIAMGKGSSLLVFRYFSNAYVQFIRGTPLIMQIYLFYYIVGTAWGISNRILAGVVILSIFEGAYIAEIIRGSLLSLDQKQIEAARAVGFNKKQIIKIVILPQMMARTLPALTGQFASIIKDSSLLSLIAVIELMQTFREITAGNYNFFGGYIFLGCLYLILTLPISYISSRLEKSFAYEN